MPLHYFHCTNGVDLVLDRRGRRVAAPHIARMATVVADRIMSGLPGMSDWSDWLVNVYDGQGSVVAILPFPHKRG